MAVGRGLPTVPAHTEENGSVARYVVTERHARSTQMLPKLTNLSNGEPIVPHVAGTRRVHDTQVNPPRRCAPADQPSVLRSAGRSAAWRKSTPWRGALSFLRAVRLIARLSPFVHLNVLLLHLSKYLAGVLRVLAT